MSDNPNISAKKAALIAAKDKAPIQVGEKVYFRECDIPNFFPRNPTRTKNFRVAAIEGDILLVEDMESRKPTPIRIEKAKVCARDILDIGPNPFSKAENVSFVAFTLESILFKIGETSRKSEIARTIKTDTGFDIPECCWNPWILDAEGNRVFYQREFVWKLKDKQLLIDSIYNRIDCGRVLVRKRSWNWVNNEHAAGNTDAAFTDIVDGKQRLKAISDFVDNKFRDSLGNYWGDLSFRAQSEIRNFQAFAYGELPESATDEDTIRQFLKTNFTGVQISRKHIEFVQSIKF